MRGLLAGTALIACTDGHAAERNRPLVTAQPPSRDRDVARYFVDPARHPAPDRAALIAMLRKRVKYVFVIFNENESFDHEYGSFPGADGVYADERGRRDAAHTPGFAQTYVDEASGDTVTARPFRLGPAQNATVMDSVDHSHTGLARKLHVVDGTPRMDGFAQIEFGGKSGPAKTAAQIARGRQYANLVMSHIDCDTIPFFWRYANRFTLFDNIFATEDTPSTPNAIAMLAGQAGETQWVKHGVAGFTGPIGGTVNGDHYAGTGTTTGVPMTGDPNPFWGSEFDRGAEPRQPTAPSEHYGHRGSEPYNVSTNLTFATVPLDAMGRDIRRTLAGDRDPAANQADIQQDIPAIEASGHVPVAWRWYQNGYDHEPTDPAGVASHRNFVAHHEGPQYFGYLADNDATRASLRGEGDFFADIAGRTLPAEGGIIYIRGGLGNLAGMEVPIQNRAYPAALTDADVKAIRDAKDGDDDHPGYADHQITEAMNARVINAIAADPALWAQSAIVITYDESDGFYDHVPPRILSYGPDGLPLSRGVRVPLLVISPYARVHTVSHAEGDHNAVIQTIEEVFGLQPLASLPDEKAALAAGDAPAFNRFGPPGFHQKYLGPRDLNSPVTDSLLSAFDPARLAGTAPALPGSYATIPAAVLAALPHYGGQGCRAIGMVPEDVRQGVVTGPPPGFNPLPSTLPQYNGVVK
ncbi:phospholipase C [Sphingomonas bacterium]|uniref:phospholipase C n=1 Tax=Sphingomonas bacterium TaxID=1895847 RepID=UPI0015754931|nr:alkaline phosphatase family protein [Sphingomonas bacterium]